MYLHIGGERIIALQEIIAVLSSQALESAPDGQIFLEHARQTGTMFRTSEERPNSYIITTHGVYSSSISAATLKRRAGNPQLLSEGE